MDFENCRHLTVIGLCDTGPRVICSTVGEEGLVHLPRLLVAAVVCCLSYSQGLPVLTACPLSCRKSKILIDKQADGQITVKIYRRSSVFMIPAPGLRLSRRTPLPCKPHEEHSTGGRSADELTGLSVVLS